ncbi:MAG: hypothetical protein OEV30_12875 [Ignavibacteria bacterium]|nr:hypothetical protein [Ignavibacteria bacterium]
MMNTIAIRRETKDNTQRRAPLAPEHVRELVTTRGLRVLVQPWTQRVFSDKEYEDAGATLTDDLSAANIIFGVKEIAPDLFLDGKAYVFFSHTVKGQRYNMPMLQAILDRNATLFDYELVRNREGKRLIFFGKYAGYAGMIDSFWALGKRLMWESIPSPFSSVRYATRYDNLPEVRDHFTEIGRTIDQEGIDRRLVPFICGFTGYGQVSRGAQQVFDLLPNQEIDAADLPAFIERGVFSDRKLYKVQFRKPDMFRHRESGKLFDPGEFKDHPDRYRSIFLRSLPFLTMLVNGIYWEPAFPRLITKRGIKRLYDRGEHRLRVIGDITCDVEGSIELTVKTTDVENPVFVYEPAGGTVIDGWEGDGPVILAVDKLPTEMPREASTAFGDTLAPFVPELAAVDYREPASRLALPFEFQMALIAHRGQLAPSQKHLKQYLKSAERSPG